MQDRYLMALDAGTGAGRCFLISADGRLASSAYKEWSYTTPPGLPMASSFDSEQFWQILAACSREALHKAGIHGEQVLAVSSTSQREGCVFVDANGQELYAGPNRDMRGAFEGMQLAGYYGAELYRRTGHYPNGLFPAARLLWYKTHAPAVFDRIAHVLMINDWILFRLSGEAACEPTNGGETLLYDLCAHDWTRDLIEKLELPENIFPPVLDPGARLGRVSERAAEETGLVAGTPVVVGGADTQCGLLGCGVLNPGSMAAISGTSTPIQMVTDRLMIDEKVRTWGGAHAIPGLFVLESNAGSTGIIYEWYRDAFCQEEIEQARAEGTSPYALMNARAERVPPGANGARSFLGTMIFNAKTIVLPAGTMDLGLAAVSASPSAGKDMLTRAIIESLAFTVRANADQIIEVAGRRPAALGVTGGLARSELYLRILANVMQMPLRVSCWREGSAVGAAICAGIGAGVYRGFEEGVAALVRFDPEVDPDPKLSRQYQTVYKKWLQAYKALGLAGG